MKGASVDVSGKSERIRLNRKKPLRLGNLSAGEERGIPSVAVKCVDIRRNTSCEGGSLDCN